ncbi:MAG: hypothetical protein QW331_03180 [Candidatus Woesearchaeota archaeon]
MEKKKRLTLAEEFQIMLLVLDKFLWLGFGVMAFGLYKVLSENSITAGIYYLLSGSILLILFVWLIVKEYEVVA